MKNNNPLNNSNVSFFTKNRNMVVFGIILLFLIIVGIVLYRNEGSLLEDNMEEIKPITDFGLPPLPSVGRKCKNDKKEKEIEDEPDNVNLLDNIRDKSVSDELNKKQVYNISNNIFSYQDARAACKAHGGDLIYISPSFGYIQKRW